MTVVELAAGETGRAFEAMRALRPHLADEVEFVRRVDELQRPQGFRLVAVVEDDGAVTAVHRQDAHRLYFNCGLRISSHHFQRELG